MKNINKQEMSLAKLFWKTYQTKAFSQVDRPKNYASFKVLTV